MTFWAMILESSQAGEGGANSRDLGLSACLFSDKDAEAKRMKQLLKVIKLVRVQDALEKNARL